MRAGPGHSYESISMIEADDLQCQRMVKAPARFVKRFSVKGNNLLDGPGGARRPPLRHERLAGGTAIEEGAALASRVAGAAGVTAVADEHYVKEVLVFRRHLRLQAFLRFLRRELGVDQAEAGGDAVDVGIDGEGGLAQGKEEDAGRRFRADGGQAAQPVAGLVVGQ